MRFHGCLIAALLLVSARPTTRPQQPPRFTDRADVVRILLDVRVIDQRGQALAGLEAEDFSVRIAGKEARIDSAAWVAGALSGIDPPREGSTTRVWRPPDGRLIVLLFQKSMESSRIIGLMRMLIEARDFLQTFTPADRIAVLSFETHLRVWLDFTNNLERVRTALDRSVLFNEPLAVSESAGPSLLSSFSQSAARHTYSIERALELIGKALEPLAGAKSVILFGHGFGRFGRDGVRMENEYGPAAEALVKARASVFTLDITQADYHSLEVGLQLVAKHTGGFYERTFHFSRAPLDRLAAALAGHYALFVEKPAAVKPGTHRLVVELKRRRGTIFARDAVTFWRAEG